MPRVHALRLRPVLVLALLGLAAAVPAARAQVTRAFTPRFTTNVNGNIRIVANTLTTCRTSASGCVAAREGGSPNNSFTIDHVDVDSDASTFNSSSATLALPTGARVLWAGLYWSAERSSRGNAAAPSGANVVSFRTPTMAAYQNITAQQFDDGPGYYAYAGFTEVTSLVQAAGAGVYTLGNVEVAAGNTNMFAGWSLIVAYENAADPFRNLTVNDGAATVSGSNRVTITPGGFTTPLAGAFSTYVGVVATDGDDGGSIYTGDSLKVNGTAISNALNPANNFFNSTISEEGVHNAGRNPSYKNTFGYDADRVLLPAGVLANGATQATLRMTTGGETYAVHAVTFATDAYRPDVAVTKSFVDLNGGAVRVGDVLEYTITARNASTEPATQAVFTDAIPAYTTYVPGSLVVAAGPGVGVQTDASGDDRAEYVASGTPRVVFRVGTGATASAGGSIAGNSTTSVTFRVVVNSGTPDGATILNRGDLSFFDRTANRTVTTSGSATAAVAVGTDLVVTKTASQPTVTGGSTFTYRVVYRNDGPDAASGVLVRDALPAGVTYVSATAPTGWTVAPPSGGASNVDFTRATSAADETATFVITVRANTAATGSTIDNTASVSSSTPEANASNNTATATVTVVQPVDVSVTQTVDRTDVAVGQTVTFTVRVQNAGPGTATGVAVRDALPAGLTFVSATPSTGTYAGDVWSVGTLAAGQSQTLTITARVTAAGPIASTAEAIAYDGPDVDSAPNNGVATEDDQATVVVRGLQADLSLTKTASDPTPVAGDDVTYTLLLSNAGNAAAGDVVVADRMPTGLAFVSATPERGTFDPATGRWSVGTVGVGETVRLRVVATVTGAGPYTNVAEVVASNLPDPDSAPGNNDPSEDDQASATVGGRLIDISVQTSTPAATVERGETTTVTVTVRNDGSADATGVAVAAALPSGLTFVGAAPSTGAYDPATGLWTVGALPVGASAVLVVTVRADADGPMAMTAQVSAAGQPDVDSTPGNNVAAEDDQDGVALTVTPLADLSLTKAVSDASPVAGSTVTYTLVVRNAGPSAATGVGVRDAMPAGVTFVSATAPGGSFDSATGLWTVGSLAVGASATLTVRAVVPGPGPYTNLAEVATAAQRDPDSTPGNGSATEDDNGSATVGGRLIDLALVASVADADVPLGSNATVRITLRNDGAADASGVAVTATLPAGLTFVSATPSVGSYDASTGRWTVGDLAIGQSVTLDLVATVTQTGPQRVGAEVVDAAQPDSDSTPANGDATEDDQDFVVVTGRAADLALTKTVSTATPRIGDTVDFTIRVVNRSTDAAPGVVVAERLPSGYAYVAASASQGAFDAATGLWTVGDVASGGAATLTLTARVLPSGDYRNTAEIVAAGLPDPNSTPGNGSGSEDDEDAAVTTPASAVADLSLAKTVDRPAPRVGDVVTYTVTLRNAGPGDATGVEVTETMPSGVAFVSANAATGTFDGTVWRVPALAAGDTAVLTITGRATTAGTYANVAEITASDLPDPDSTPGNGAGGEDDRATATTTTTGTSGGANAGVESEGSMAVLLAQRLYLRREDVAAQGTLLAPMAPVAFEAASATPAVVTMGDAAPTTSASATGSVSVLRQIVPTSGPESAAALETTPGDLLGVTNAREVVAADFVRSDGVRLGAMFGATSPGGVLYDHAKATCDRLGGGRLDDVRRLVVNGRSFVLSTLVHADGTADYAVSFVAYRKGAGYTIESKFAPGQYAPPAGTDEVLNLQVWSVSPAYTATLVAATLARLEAQGPVAYRNDASSSVSLPSVYVVDGRYEGGRVVLRVRNTTGARVTTTLRGTIAATEADASAGRRAAYSQAITVAPSSETALTTVTLPVGSLFDASFQIDAAASGDMFYFADGTWSHNAGAEASVTTFATTAETRAPQPGTLLVERSARIDGTVKDFASLFRYLRPGGQPVDLSAYTALEFTYRSTVPVQVLVEKASVTTWNGKFVANLPANPTGAPVRLAFADLRPSSGGSTPFAANDVTMLAFYAVGDRSTRRSFSLAVENVRFSGARTTDAESEGGPLELALAQSAPNPARTSAAIRFTLPETGRVRLAIYDLMGREVAVLVDGETAAGSHTATLDASSLAAGAYVYRLTTPAKTLTRTLVVVR